MSCDQLYLYRVVFTEFDIGVIVAFSIKCVFKSMFQLNLCLAIFQPLTFLSVPLEVVVTSFKSD